MVWHLHGDLVYSWRNVSRLSSKSVGLLCNINKGKEDEDKTRCPCLLLILALHSALLAQKQKVIGAAGQKQQKGIILDERVPTAAAKTRWRPHPC